MADEEAVPTGPPDPFKVWELHLFGHVINSDDILVGLACKIEKDVGVRWSYLRAYANLTFSTITLQAVAAILVADKLGIDIGVAKEKVDGLTERELVAALVLVDDDKPTAYENGFPTSAGEDSTT